MRTSRDLKAALIAVGLAVSLVSACAGKSVRSQPDDLTITTRVKTALLNDRDITAPSIDVETTKGVVTLSGKVATKQEEQRAIQVARSVPGVADVRSTLQIEKQR